MLMDSLKSEIAVVKKKAKQDAYAAQSFLRMNLEPISASILESMVLIVLREVLAKGFLGQGVLVEMRRLFPSLNPIMRILLSSDHRSNPAIF